MNGYTPSTTGPTASRDQNGVPTLLGVSSTDGETPTLVWVNPSTHRVLVDDAGGGSTFVDNEIVSGSGYSWTLAQTPLLGVEHIYANGQRLTPGAGNDYTISGNVITTANSYATGSVLADYQTS
jgi:hypothetical protein